MELELEILREIDMSFPSSRLPSLLLVLEIE
jgi:hypothetical protein